MSKTVIKVDIPFGTDSFNVHNYTAQVQQYINSQVNEMYVKENGHHSYYIIVEVIPV